MAKHTIEINRAPVLTLWGAVVSARMGYDWQEALSLGRAVAGLNAQSKGRRLGIFGEPKAPERGKPPKKVGLGEDFWLQVVGRPVPAKRTEDGVRAVVRDKPVDPAQADRYLKSKFGEHFEAARQAMTDLAQSFGPEELAAAAFSLYETFRPTVASGRKGWGQKGELSLDLIRSLAKPS
jgi:hypothetical protein